MVLDIDMVLLFVRGVGFQVSGLNRNMGVVGEGDSKEICRYQIFSAEGSRS
jgi:hypothetical protein